MTNFCSECIYKKGRLFREPVCTKAQIYDPVNGKATIPLRELAVCRGVRMVYPEKCPDFVRYAYELY